MAWLERRVSDRKYISHCTAGTGVRVNKIMPRVWRDSERTKTEATAGAEGEDVEVQNHCQTRMKRTRRHLTKPRLEKCLSV